MKVTIKDADILRTIQPQQAAAYLKANNWQEWQQIPNKASVWMKKLDSGEDIHVILPINTDIPGYPISMNAMLEILETVTERSQIEILNELLVTPVTSPYKIQGMVMAINSEKTTGKVTLIGVVAGRLEKIIANLGELDYGVAVKAYRERLPVVFVGDLSQKKGEFVLENIQDFRLDETWKN